MSDRIEQAAPDVREVLELAFFDIYGREPDKVHIPEWNQWRDREMRFRRFLDAEAYTDAALMLVPVGGSWAVGMQSGGVSGASVFLNGGAMFRTEAATPALAIAAASLRAKGPGHEQ